VLHLCDVDKLLLAANVGDASRPGSNTVSLVDVASRVMIADPPQIIVVEPSPPRVARVLPVPAAGPHGLEVDLDTDRLFCACDAGQLIVLDAHTGQIAAVCALAGAPDVIFFNSARHHLYVAIGDPGLVEVFDTDSLDRLQSVATEPGAHTCL
jgi:hypothetical protein